jgi:hypothetical protein
MSEFEKGMLVQHASLGLGKIVALEPKAVHVFFVGRDSRFAAKLRLPGAASLLRPAEPGERAWLGGVSAFALDAGTGRYGYAETWIPHEEALERFLETYPKGFADPLYTGEGKGRQARPARIRRAHDAWVAAFGDGQGERILAEGAVPQLVEAALAVEKLAGASQSGADKATLAAGLSDPAAATAFFAALFEYLATPAPEQGRFEALAAAVAAFPNEAGVPCWPLVTVLPFLARPDREMLLRPKLTSQAAHRLGLELRFAAEPNWTTYSTLLRSSEQLLEKLRAVGAQDLVDVEAFLTVVTTRAAVRTAAPRAAAETDETPAEIEAEE